MVSFIFNRNFIEIRRLVAHPAGSRHFPHMARKLFPMPVEPIIRHPLAITLPCAAFGMLMRLCCHFWDSECRPLPRDQESLMHICRAHRPTWSGHKTAVLQVFSDIQPELSAYYARRSSGRQQLRIAARNGRSIQTARAVAERLAASAPALPDIKDAHQLGFTPKREKPSERPPAPDKRPPRPIRVDTLNKP